MILLAVELCLDAKADSKQCARLRIMLHGSSRNRNGFMRFIDASAC
jgi:hypothetical protein